MNIESNTVEISTQPAMVGLQYVRRIFSSGNIKLINADCMDIMKQYPDKYFDLAVVDPPYGIDEKFKGGKTGKMNFNEIVKDEWDKVPDENYFNELFRVSKNQIIWGGNYFKLPPTRCFIVWDKLISEDFSLAMCELAWTSFDKLAKIKKLNNNKLNRIHPTEKPIQLYNWTFHNFATKEMKIIDTHGGSFNSAISAKNLKCTEFVGIEKSEKQFEKSVSNFIEKTRALKLDL